MKSSTFSCVYWPLSYSVFKFLSKSLAYFCIEWCVCFLLLYRIFSILDMGHLTDVHIVDILSHSVVCIFCLLMLPSDGWKVFNLMLSKLPIMFFMLEAFLYNCPSHLSLPLGNEVILLDSPFPRYSHSSFSFMSLFKCHLLREIFPDHLI